MVKCSRCQHKMPDGTSVCEKCGLNLEENPSEQTSVYRPDEGPNNIILSGWGKATFDEQDQVILIRQYKHGPRRVGLHVPGGYLASGENPLETARRELLEETGYASDRWRSLGSYTCNANQGCGRAHLFAATHARRVTAPKPGDLEQMEVVLLSREAVSAALAGGQVHTIDNAAALLLALKSMTP